ncbi:MAG: hypothetical protein ACYTFY_12095 [Planctomycetota bacterium]|jgi:hypothetical protein
MEDNLDDIRGKIYELSFGCPLKKESSACSMKKLRAMDAVDCDTKIREMPKDEASDILDFHEECKEG